MPSLLEHSDISLISERDLHWLNAIDVTSRRALDKYEVLYQTFRDTASINGTELVCLTWELVDWLDRTRKILNSASGMKRKDPVRVLAERALKDIVEIRNTLQHFNDYVGKAISAEYAPLGNVIAVVVTERDPNRNAIEFAIVSAVPGVLMKGKKIGEMEIPNTIRDDIEHITLQIGDLSYPPKFGH